MAWPKGQPRAKRNEQSADSTAPAAVADAAAEGSDQGAAPAEAAPPAAVEQGSTQTPVKTLPALAPVPAHPMPTDLEGFIAHCERLKQPDLVLVAVRHPEIRQARHRDGTFSGFSMEPGGAPWAKWNDGSTFPAHIAQA